MLDYHRPAACAANLQQKAARDCLHQAADLERVFHATFMPLWRTCLRGGAAEPLYQPGGNPQTPAIIFYREDYFASALHEIAHWCLAGTSRREQQDYGYWYAPDGRDDAMQIRFEVVEQKPQALEWLFAMACDFPFSVSLDNLDGDVDRDRQQCFALAVCEQAMQYCVAGLPSRAGDFLHALCRHYGRFNSSLAAQSMLGLLQDAHRRLSAPATGCAL